MEVVLRCMKCLPCVLCALGFCSILPWSNRVLATGLTKGVVLARWGLSHAHTSYYIDYIRCIRLHPHAKHHLEFVSSSCSCCSSCCEASPNGSCTVTQTQKIRWSDAGTGHPQALPKHTSAEKPQDEEFPWNIS